MYYYVAVILVFLSALLSYVVCNTMLMLYLFSSLFFSPMWYVLLCCSYTCFPLCSSLLGGMYYFVDVILVILSALLSYVVCITMLLL